MDKIDTNDKIVIKTPEKRKGRIEDFFKHKILSEG